MHDIHSIENRIATAVENQDRQALNDLLAEMYQKSDAPPRPFDAAIELKPEYRQALAEGAAESALALNWANRISRAERWVAYQLRMSSGFNGMQIVEEGDSWFQYPLRLRDIIDFLSDDPDKAIRSLSGAGDLLRDMAARREYIPALQRSGARIMLLSGGGNDLLGGGALIRVLREWRDGMRAEEALDGPALDQLVGSVLSDFRRILTDVQTVTPGVTVFSHGYDLPHPRPNGAWLGGPLAARGIPLDAGRAVIGLIVTRFATELKALERRFPTFRFLDMTGVVGGNEQSWADELHPKDAGYGRVAEVFRHAIAQVSGAHEARLFPVGAGPAPAHEAGPGWIVMLDPGHGGPPGPGRRDSSWNNAIGPRGTLEKTLTLDVAERARMHLISRGRTAALTRTGDIHMGLRKRAGMARKCGADVFVSIHFNASRGHDAQGTECFVHPSRNADSDRLCRSVQAATVAALGLKDRNRGHSGGVKTGGYGVINPASHADRTAAVLLEVSFLDRLDEEERLQGEAYRDRIARAIADGIDAYLGAGVATESMLVDETDEPGDAIEAGAAAAGMTVIQWLGAAEHAAPPADAPHPEPWDGETVLPAAAQGGHAILESAATEATGAAAESYLDWVAASLRRGPVAWQADEQNDQDDRNEFSTVPIGEGYGASPLDVTARSLAVFESGTVSGFDHRRFEARIAALNLRHFVAAEFLVMGGSNVAGPCAGTNSLPPEELWPNIEASALMLDEIRQRLGAAVTISSCYRSPVYNRCIGGARASLHLRFNAIDWTCAAGRPRDWAAAARAVRQSNPRFAGGIGVYRSFVHIDTRGHAAEWEG